MLAFAFVLFAALLFEYDLTARGTETTLHSTARTARHFGQIGHLGFLLMQIHVAKVRR